MAVVDAVLNEIVEAEVSDATRTAAEYVSAANRYELSVVLLTIQYHFTISCPSVFSTSLKSNTVFVPQCDRQRAGHGPE